MQRLFTRKALILIVLMIPGARHALAQETKLKWLGHAAFSITTPNGKVLLIELHSYKKRLRWLDTTG